jgi:hypothetical protein
MREKSRIPHYEARSENMAGSWRAGPKSRSCSRKVHTEPWRDTTFAVKARMRPAQKGLGKGKGNKQNIKYPHNMTAFFVECKVHSASIRPTNSLLYADNFSSAVASEMACS